MVKRKKDLDEKFLEKISKKLIPDFKEFEKSDDPMIRAEKMNEIIAKGFNEHVLQISKLTEKQFEALEIQIHKNYQKFVSEIRKKGFELSVKYGNLDMKNVGVMISNMDYTKYDSLEETKKVDKLLKNKIVLERLYKLEIIARTVQQLNLSMVYLDMKPITDLEKIVKNRFGNDIQWCYATAILATHENLVKKKLIDLNISEKEIQQILKEKKFQGLVNHLGKEIEKREKRKLSLSFYKSPSLREMRNKLDHEGYKQSVKIDDVIDLIKEIKLFEKELFNQPDKKVKKSK